MGTARSVFFTVSSAMMIIAGAGSLIASVWIAIARIDAPLSSPALVLIAAAFMVIASVMNMISGVGGVRNHNRRTNSSTIIQIPEASLILCVLSILFSVINGIIIWHMIVIIVTGILVPAVFIYAAIKKSYL